MTVATKEEALDLFEWTRPDYLTQARAFATRFAKSNPTITIEDVWQHCPPPDTINSNVMGAVFRGDQWEVVGFVKAQRPSSHSRRICVYRLVP